MQHANFNQFCQYPWDLGSAPPERVGQGEVGVCCNTRLRNGPPSANQGLSTTMAEAVMLSQPSFLSSFAWMGLENSLLVMKGLNSGQWCFFSICMGSHSLEP